MSLPNLAAPSVLSASKLNGPSNLSTTNHISLLHRLYYNRTKIFIWSLTLIKRLNNFIFYLFHFCISKNIKGTSFCTFMVSNPLMALMFQYYSVKILLDTLLEQLSMINFTSATFLYLISRSTVPWHKKLFSVFLCKSLCDVCLAT